MGEPYQGVPPYFFGRLRMEMQFSALLNANTLRYEDGACAVTKVRA